MHEKGETRVRLPARPVERAIVKKIAEVTARRTRCHGGETGSSEMRGEPDGRQLRVEAIGSFRVDHSAYRQSVAGIGPQRGAVVGRTLDAERVGALADTEMNHYMRLQRLAEARHERGDHLPLCGQDAG